MGNSIQDRVAEVIQGSHKSVKKLSDEVGVSRNTIYRWRDQETEKFDDEEKLKALAKATHVEFEWLIKGDVEKSDDPKINEIERRVAEKGESYKGLDQTIADVESKANNLKQDLESLIQDLKKLRSD